MYFYYSNSQILLSDVHFQWMHSKVSYSPSSPSFVLMCFTVIYIYIYTCYSISVYGFRSITRFRSAESLLAFCKQGYIIVNFCNQISMMSAYNNNTYMGVYGRNHAQEVVQQVQFEDIDFC